MTFNPSFRPTPQISLVSNSNTIQDTVMTTAASDTAQLRKFAAVENPFEEVLNSEHPWSIMDIGCNAISVSLLAGFLLYHLQLYCPRHLYSCQTILINVGINFLYD